MYFTILIAINSLNKLPDFYKRMNLNSELHIMHFKYKLKSTLINDDYLFKMIKCCGNSFFNKEDKYYFVRPQDFIPIYLAFKNIIINVPQKNKLLNKISETVKNQLIEYGHFDFEESFSILKSIDIFQNEFDRLDKSFTHFLVHYFSMDKQELPVQKKKKIIVRKTKK